MTTPKSDGAKPKRAPRNIKKYVRNITRSQVAFRIGGREGRRVELNPRGQRADLAPVSKEELDQLEDVNTLYEIITETEAKDIIAKQVTNQQAYHPALSALRNELGKPYQDGAVALVQDNSVHVASVQTPGLEDGSKHVQIERRVGVIAPPQVSVPGSTDPHEAADAAARNSQLEGPAAGGIRGVVMAPVQRS